MSSDIKDVVLLIGPSQVGKTTIQNRLLSFDFFERVVTCTTRKPRYIEVDGEDYKFYEREQFEQMLRFDRFVEHNEYSGNLYGTEISEYQRIGNLKKVALQVVDVNGARNIQRWCDLNHATCHSLFIAPTSIGVIEKRLHGLTDGRERIRTAIKELDQAYSFDHVFINKKVSTCVNQILSFLDGKGVLYVQ